jgi:outer membrane receptor for ferrienterochelin and colicins
MKLLLQLLFVIGFAHISQGQVRQGRVTATRQPIAGATVSWGATAVVTDSAGFFTIIAPTNPLADIQVTAVGFQTWKKRPSAADTTFISVELLQSQEGLDEIVVTGTLKAVRRLETPVPVEVYSPSFFQKNPTPSIFDGLQAINGVRPQVNCNICNTGDVRINGMEGPYSMVLIDGMPIVSSLSTVYGLSGIPSSLIERIEVVKGPASSLYGSEAVGGLINVITKSAPSAPQFAADVMNTSWSELNLDLSFAKKVGKKAAVLTGVNLFNYGNIRDDNEDGFTDVTLQKRVSIFQKWNFYRQQNRQMSVAARYFYEDRWGGETNWTKAFRGGDSIYGESIYTSRLELLGNYQLPVKEKMMLQFSYNQHHQNSLYGTNAYLAQQNIAFTQLTWDKSFRRHDWLAGAAMRFTHYDDNTPATASPDPLNPKSRPQKTWLPGFFLQDEISVSAIQKLLLGLRYDHHPIHGAVVTPRLAYKLKLSNQHTLRLNAGTGYRVVNLFTEDHAALTGAREVVIRNNLQPEKSYNANINYLYKCFAASGFQLLLETSAWYTYFNNRILGNFDANPNQIVYDNLDGHAISQGVSVNVDARWPSGFKLLAGTTLQDVAIIENGTKTRQILTERYAATWALSYAFKRLKLAIDYTGNLYGPMRLPLLGPLDPRQPYSPIWSTQNLQLSWSGNKKWTLYGGVKNLLNFRPTNGNPFIIARSHDPFDKQVVFDSSGQVMATPNNPYALSFDPNYLFAPNQGIRAFLGWRLQIQ